MFLYSDVSSRFPGWLWRWDLGIWLFFAYIYWQLWHCCGIHPWTGVHTDVPCHHLQTLGCSVPCKLSTGQQHELRRSLGWYSCRCLLPLLRIAMFLREEFVKKASALKITWVRTNNSQIGTTHTHQRVVEWKWMYPRSVHCLAMQRTRRDTTAPIKTTLQVESKLPTWDSTTHVYTRKNRLLAPIVSVIVMSV